MNLEDYKREKILLQSFVCEHEDAEHQWEHEEEDAPVSMNPFTDAIRYVRYRIHIGPVICLRCEKVLEEEKVSECDCPPPEPPCRCGDDCVC